MKYLNNLGKSFTRKANLGMAGLAVLYILSLLLPNFNYAGENGSVFSMLGFLGFPGKYQQLNEAIGIKYITLEQLYVPVLLIVFSVIVALICIRKNSMPVAIISAIWSFWGFVKYLTAPLFGYTNMYGHWVSFAILLLAFIVSVIEIVVYGFELKNREEGDYFISIDEM